MKIALTGPSGSGKTTLVHFLKDTYNLNWLNGSSGEIKKKEVNDALEAQGLTVGKGHAAVIQSGHANPEAGWENQCAILYAREKLFRENTHFITDRSPIDSWVYALVQCGPYQIEDRLAKFRDKAIEVANQLDYIIFVPTMFAVEDNGSRIANYYYQRFAMTPMFQEACEMFEMLSFCKIIKVTEPKLEERKLEVIKNIQKHESTR